MKKSAGAPFIILVRRITQVFFLLLVLGCCLVNILGAKWWQLSGWPVNWVLHLDPLAALATLLATKTVYRDMAWALVVVVLTLFLGRVFCGWMCPLGTLQHLVGYLAQRRRNATDRIRRNRYHPAQRLKYIVLAVLLGLSAAGLWGGDGSVQVGLLDPLPLVYRTFSLVLIPATAQIGQAGPLLARATEGAGWIALFMLLILGLAAYRPRFYCRFVCPLGALLGLLSRWVPWRIGKRDPECSNCMVCDRDCEGACNPAGKIRVSECLVCANCLHTCHEDQMGYRTQSSAAGEFVSPDLTRRGFLLAVGAGVATVPVMRLNRALGSNANPGVLRPPGSLAEEDFLARCIKCGQCMKICPTNIIQPALGQGGLEGLWTPVLNYRVGSSGCELNCVACGHLCPTAAIRPLTVAEKRGQGAYADKGPVRLGLAFVDRDRCLPWAFGKSCIVCQEVCPVSPKAIEVRDGRPWVLADRCIGCGVCEHECPVHGLRAIRVTAENESRHPDRVMTI